MDLLQEILLRAQQAVPPQDVPTDLPGQPKLSLIERLMGQRMQRPSPFPAIDQPPAVAAAAAPGMQPQAPIVAPGITGPDSTTARAPMSPLDPNYATPNAAPPNFLTPGERDMQTLVDPAAASSPRPPMPAPRPAAAPSRESDGSMPSTDPADSPAPQGAMSPPSVDVGARSRTPPGLQASPQIAPTPQQLEAPPPEQSMFGRLGDFGNTIMSGLKNNSNTLLAIGAGFAGAPNIGQGISRASAAAIPASQQDLKNRTSLQGQGALYKTLLDAGVPKQQALAAMSNPELAKRLMEGYISDRKTEIKTIKSKDEWGNETERLVAINPYTLEQRDLSGGGGGGQGGGTNPMGGTTGGFFAPGVTQVDPNRVGDDYLDQFSPKVQAAVRSYAEGKSMPQGERKFVQNIKSIAQKWGEDTGLEVSDQAYFKRKKMQTELGSIAPSTMGGQVKAFRQALHHAGEVADYVEKYAPSGGLGFEPVAQGINKLSNVRTKNTDMANSINAAAQSLAGEIGKLFSGQSGGGVHERELTMNRFNAINSGPATAGSLEATLKLMDGGLRALEKAHHDTMGKDANFIGKEEQAKIDHIRDVIKRLRGEADAAKETKPTGATAPKINWRVVPQQ